MRGIRWEPYDGGGLNLGFHVDEVDGTVTAVYDQPMERIIRENQFRRRHEDNSVRRRSGKLYEIANIPYKIAMYWKTHLGVDIMDQGDFPKVLQLIQSPEWAEAVMVCQGSFAQRPKRQFFTGPRDQVSHPLGSNRARLGGAIARGIHP